MLPVSNLGEESFAGFAGASRYFHLLAVRPDAEPDHFVCPATALHHDETGAFVEVNFVGLVDLGMANGNLRNIGPSLDQRVARGRDHGRFLKPVGRIPPTAVATVRTAVVVFPNHIGSQQRQGEQTQ